MIAIQPLDNLVTANVIGEFTLADYREFEERVLEKLGSGNKVNVLIDLRDMLRYTLDVAWEDIRFTRSHGHDFGKIAVVTDSQWLAWSAWLSSLFVDAEVRVFEDDRAALDWLEAA